jgi:hypothetical protein
MTVTTWNAADKSATVALSGGALIATTSGAGAVRSIGNIYSAGKVYFELSTGSTQSDMSIGIANATETLTLAEQLGSTLNSFGAYQFFNRDAFINNANLVGGGGGEVTGVNGFAFDFTNGLGWWTSPGMRTGGTPWNNRVIGSANPATGVGGFSLATLHAGPYMIAFGFDNASGICSLNAGSGGFGLTVPTGFSGWDATIVVADQGGMFLF